MRKMLIGIHDKNCSLRAVDYVMKQFPGARDIEVDLVHIFPNLPAMYWDDGHVLSAEEERDRAKVIERWIAGEREFIVPIMEGAANELVRRGFPRERVRTRLVLGTSDVADSLLDEAAAGKFDTIVVGRCGLAEGKHFVVGSIVSKLIHKAVGLAVCVVQ